MTAASKTMEEKFKMKRWKQQEEREEQHVCALDTNRLLDTTERWLMDWKHKADWLECVFTHFESNTFEPRSDIHKCTDM